MTSPINANGWKRSLPVVFLLVLVGLALAPRLAIGASEAPLHEFAVGPPQDAEAIFQAQCATCHTIGGGDRVGPDLEGVTTRRERDWLARWIIDPPAVISDGDPIATDLLEQFNGVTMPALGLSEADVEALIVYFEQLDGGAAPAPTAAPIAEPGDGDAEVGRTLFTGSRRLANGGPSCRTCHSIAGIGAFSGGGNLGPDLTSAYDRLGDAMITWPQTGTMQPIFTDQELTEAEQADLLAFFRSTDVTERAGMVIWQLAGLSVLGAALIALAAHLIWRRRLAGVRGPMVNGRK